MLAKRTSKNQLTLPKAMVEKVGSPTYFSATVKSGRIVLTPVNIGAADAVRAKIRRLGITERDIDNAVAWARKQK
jgi:hypothetical protein